ARRLSRAPTHRAVPSAIGDQVVLDTPTRRPLEIDRSPWGGGRAGTLLSVIDRTVTPMGARRLHAWLLSPLLDVPAIEARLDAVAELAADSGLRARLRDPMKGIRDLERLLGRVTLGTANARDLVALRDSLAPLPGLAALASSMSSRLLSGLPGPLVSSDTDGPPASL